MNKDEEMMRALRERRGPSRALVFGGVGGVVLLGAIAIAISSMGGDSANRAYSALSRCMIGEPLAAGENVFFRIREVELAERLEPAAGDAAWPARCAPYATELFQSVDGSGESALLSRLLREQMSCGNTENEPCKFPTSGQPLPKADETWKAAELAGLTLVDVPDVPAPKARLTPVLGKQWPALGAGDLVLADHRFAENGELWILLKPGRESKASVRWCRITPSGDKANCSDVRGLPRDLEDPKLIADRGVAALIGDYSSDQGMERGAFGLSDGKPLKTRIDVHRGAAIERRGDDFYLLAIEGGLVRHQAPIDVPKGSEPFVFLDMVGWFERADEGERKLSFKKRGPEASLEKDVIEVPGPIPPRVDPCVTPDGGALYGRSGDRQTVWFVTGGGVSKPVSGKVPSGARREWSAVCSTKRLTRSWVTMAGESATLGVLDCSPQACKNGRAQWKGETVKQWLAVSELGDSTLVLYETFEDDKRLRLAPLAKIADTRPVQLVDSFDYSGPKFERARVLIGPRLVVVLFDDEKELHALYVNADGKYGAVTP